MNAHSLITRFGIALSVLLLLTMSFGCSSGKKKGAKKDYGKPTWLKIDKPKLTKLSSDETNLEGGTVTVYDPEGWERQPPGSAKPPKGFKSVIVFKKGGATLMMTKSKNAKEMPDLDEENIEGFAESAQTLFKAPVKMLKLGSIVGVIFGKRVADTNRLSKFYDRRIVATSINGQLFTYELVAEQGEIKESLLNALFALISKTKIAGVEAPPEEETTVASTTPEKPKKEEPKKEEPTVAAATPEEPKKEEPVVAAAPKEEPKKEATKKEEPVVAAAPKEEPKKEEPKAAKPAAPKKDKSNTKAILDELDSLLN